MGKVLIIVGLFLLTACSHHPYKEPYEPGASVRFIGVDRQEVKKVIKRHQPEIKECYFSELDRDRNTEPEGKVVIQFEIGELGKVLNTQTLSSTFPNKTVASCLAQHLKTWKFPAPLIGDTAIVSYPFTFNAEE